MCDGEHPKAKFSVSTVVKIKNFIRVEINKANKEKLSLYHPVASISVSGYTPSAKDRSGYTPSAI